MFKFFMFNRTTSSSLLKLATKLQYECIPLENNFLTFCERHTPVRDCECAKAKTQIMLSCSALERASF